jgi:hypothetical protein
VIETITAVAPAASSNGPQPASTFPFVIEYLDENFRRGEIACEAPTPEIALSVFRQRFRKFQNARIRKTDDCSMATQLDNLQRALVERPA